MSLQLCSDHHLLKKMSLSVRLAILLFIIDHAHTAELPGMFHRLSVNLQKQEN